VAFIARKFGCVRMRQIADATKGRKLIFSPEAAASLRRRESSAETSASSMTLKWTAWLTDSRRGVAMGRRTPRKGVGGGSSRGGAAAGGGGGGGLGGGGGGGGWGGGGGRAGLLGGRGSRGRWGSRRRLGTASFRCAAGGGGADILLGNAPADAGAGDSVDIHA